MYRLDLAERTSIDAYDVDRAPVDVELQILDGTLAADACVGSGDQLASATVGPGSVYIVVDSKTVTTEGEFLQAVQRH